MESNSDKRGAKRKNRNLNEPARFEEVVIFIIKEIRVLNKPIGLMKFFINNMIIKITICLNLIGSFKTLFFHNQCPENRHCDVGKTWRCKKGNGFCLYVDFLIFLTK